MKVKTTPIEWPLALDRKSKRGFSTGEGSFQVVIRKKSTKKSGYQVLLRFRIGQHRRDEQLFISLIGYLNCGRVKKKQKNKKKLSKKIK